MKAVLGPCSLITYLADVVRIERPGYEPYIATLKTESDRTVVHEIVLERMPSQ